MTTTVPNAGSIKVEHPLRKGAKSEYFLRGDMQELFLSVQN
jgi:hypothetical protein